MSLTPDPAYPRHIHSIAYSNLSPLNLLDITLPRPLSESDPKKSIWVIFIHGGAWRDPNQTSSELRPALQYFFPAHPPPDIPPNPVPSWPGATGPRERSADGFDPVPHIAGFASLNYRLSTHSADVSEPWRHSKHPDHVSDVREALRWLEREYGVGKEGAEGYEFVGIGHSAGAMLWAQVVGGIGLADGEVNCRLPVGVGLLAGIFDLKGLLDAHAGVQAYVDIVEGAFGKDERGWTEASPRFAGRFGQKVWPEGRVVLLGRSADDGLVEDEQTENMEKKLLEDMGLDNAEVGLGSNGIAVLKGERKGSKGKIIRWTMEGEHDGLWGDARQLAWVIEELTLRTVSFDKV